MKHFLVSIILLTLSDLCFANTIINGKGTGLIYDEKTPKYGRTYATFADCENLPEEFDLRDINVVPPVRDQGSCGSCWAFSKTASLESANAYTNGQMLNLSEQELVSCDKSQWGCNGGILRSFGYQIDKGQGLEADFPYTAKDTKCKEIQSKVKGDKFYYAGKPDRPPTEKEVMCALYTSKTIPWTVVAAEGQWGSAPSSDDGIMQKCSSRSINHAVGLVGWKTIQGKVYFKVRNSWGNKWGSTAGRSGMEKGYALAAHRCNLLNDEVAYITTERTCKPPMINIPPVITVQANVDSAVSMTDVEAGTDYVWYEGKFRIGRGQTIFVNTDRSAVYKIIAKNNCATSEAIVKVEVK